jgi:hypothetical protein
MRTRASRIIFPVAVLLGGCTSLPQQSVSQVDEQQVARVETAAARAGTRIYWMSKPLKPAAASNN